jgi:uncharacterized protein (TIGR02145 family)
MQKSILPFLFFTFNFFFVNAQNVGIGTNTPDASALLELKSSNKGLLIPRMDSTSRKAIPSTKGLLVYDSTYNSFYFNTGTSWQKMNGSTGGSQLITNGNNIGDMLYWNGSNWDVVPAGKPGQQLKVGVNNVPSFTGDELPEVQTLPVTNIGVRTATTKGKLTNTGYNSIISNQNYSGKGVCWSTSQNPTIKDPSQIFYSNSYSFPFITDANYDINLPGYSNSWNSTICNNCEDSLLVNTTYYVRALAFNSAGVAYGNQVSFTTLNGPINLPVVDNYYGGPTSSEIQLSNTSVKIINCYVYETGGALVTSRGVVYSTSPNPTLANSFVSSGSGLGYFDAQLNGLIPNTIYYYKVYATNSAGTAYGSQKAFIVSSNSNITIGNRKWATTNLSIAIDRYGQPIPKITDSTEWANASGPAWCWYKNDSATYATTYGRLYNFSAMQSILIPVGWRIPTINDYNNLIYTIDPSYDSSTLIQYNNSYDSSKSYTAGGALKETGSSHWKTPNAGATNSAGFTALPGGIRSSDGSFAGLGYNAYFWGTGINTYDPSILSLNNSNAYAIIYLFGVYFYNNPGLTNNGFSIRLVKD